jgi:hypothetical protein
MDADGHDAKQACGRTLDPDIGSRAQDVVLLVAPSFETLE